MSNNTFTTRDRSFLRLLRYYLPVAALPGSVHELRRSDIHAFATVMHEYSLFMDERGVLFTGFDKNPFGFAFQLEDRVGVHTVALAYGFRNDDPTGFVDGNSHGKMVVSPPSTFKFGRRNPHMPVEPGEPLFASFRAMLGDELYELVQAREDEAQSELLLSLPDAEPGWELYVAEIYGKVVGFVAVQLNHKTEMGEIGLNAVDPSHAGKGIGTCMYNFTLARMKEGGMNAATVATGSDASHSPARCACRKAGFSAEIPSVWMCRRL